jgi:hypothetical protein
MGRFFEQSTLVSYLNLLMRASPMCLGRIAITRFGEDTSARTNPMSAASDDATAVTNHSHRVPEVGATDAG